MLNERYTAGLRAVYAVACTLIMLCWPAAASAGGPSPVDGRIELSAGGGTFGAVYRQALSAAPRGALLIMPRPGDHPDEAAWIAALAATSAELGWASIVVETRPVARSARAPLTDDGVAELLERLSAAAEHLRAAGYYNVVAVGHATGAELLARFISSRETRAAQALIGVGEWQVDPDALRVPVLDVVPSRDRRAAALSARRADAARRGELPDYRRIEVEGAARDFAGFEAGIARSVYGWIESVTPGAAIAVSRRGE